MTELNESEQSLSTQVQAASAKLAEIRQRINRVLIGQETVA